MRNIGYDADGNLKDSDSSFFLFGADYQPSPTFLTNGRFGVQDRNRSIGTSNTNFYAEFTVLYQYLSDSFASFGVIYDTRETSVTLTFTDEKTFSIFANMQHAISPSLFISGSIYFDDAELQAQTAPLNITDQSLRLGIGVTYQPTQQLSLILSFDHDKTDSDDFFRQQDRSRVGFTVRYTFGL